MQVSSRIPTNARAIASPMPRAAPVISVIFPFNLAKIASRKHYLSHQLWARSMWQSSLKSNSGNQAPGLTARLAETRRSHLQAVSEKGYALFRRSRCAYACVDRENACTRPTRASEGAGRPGAKRMCKASCRLSTRERAEGLKLPVHGALLFWGVPHVHETNHNYLPFCSRRASSFGGYRSPFCKWRA
jgi:hypothetical protein